MTDYFETRSVKLINIMDEKDVLIFPSVKKATSAFNQYASAIPSAAKRSGTVLNKKTNKRYKVFYTN